MPFNWYKVTRIKKLQAKCVLEDKVIFADLDMDVDPLTEETDQTVETSPAVDGDHQFKPIGDRIEEGKKREDEIIDRINAGTPFILEHSGREADIRGIDAYMVGYKGRAERFPTPLTVQIKQRIKSGDDLGLEIMKGWPPPSADIRSIKWDGKDMKTPIDYYFHVDRAGTIKIFNGKAIREIAESMGTSAVTAWGHQAFNGRRYNAAPYGEVLIVPERGIGGRKTKNNFKVITYINVTELSPTYEFTL